MKTFQAILVSMTTHMKYIRLPFKVGHLMIEDNYELRKKRLSQLKKQLGNKPELKKECNDIIESHMTEKVESSGEIGEVAYLTYRAVVREDKSTTKVRVVYDASPKNKGPSLNEYLYKGQCLNSLFCNILLRFRVHNYGFIAKHRDYLQFVWFDDVYKNNPEIVKYRFIRVIFVSSPSQFLLNGTSKTHGEKYEKIDPEFVSKVFYVDDFNCGVESYEQDVDLKKIQKDKMSFHERKF